MGSVPPLRRLRALILHRTPVCEKDRVVEVFSKEEGRLKLLAAGVRRFPSRRAGHLEPLLESQLVVSTSARGDSIRDARVLHAFPRLRADLQRLRAAYAIVRLLRDGTGERLADSVLYDAVVVLFQALDAHDGAPAPAVAVLSAEIQLLRHLGLLPETRVCAQCRSTLRADQFVFDRRRSGFVCHVCAGNVEAAPGLTDAVKLLRLLADHPVPPANVTMTGAPVRALRRVLRTLFLPLKTQVGLRRESIASFSR